MALKNLMAWLQSRAADTPGTPDTPCFVDTRATTQIEPFGEAVNDPALAALPAPEPPPDPNAWRELAAAYSGHHFKCSACIAAGRGAQYGLRCGTGTGTGTAL